MARYSTKECYVCHLRRPVTEMKPKVIERRSGSSVGVYNIWGGGNKKASARAYYRKQTVWQCSPRAACNDPQYFERMAAEKALLERKVYNLNQLAADSKKWDLSQKTNNYIDYSKYYIEIENELNRLEKSYPKLKDEILKIKRDIPYETTPIDIANYIFTPDIRDADTSFKDSIFTYKEPEKKVEKIDKFLKNTSTQNNILTSGFLFYNPVWTIALLSYFSYQVIINKSNSIGEGFALIALVYLILYFYRIAKRKTLENLSHKRFIYKNIGTTTEKLKQQLIHDTGDFLNIFNDRIKESSESYNLTNWDVFDEYTETKLKLDFLSREDETEVGSIETAYSERIYKEALRGAIFGGFFGRHRAYLSESKGIARLMYIKTTLMNALALTMGLGWFVIYIWIIEILSIRSRVMQDENGLFIVPDEMRIVTKKIKKDKNKEGAITHKNTLKKTSFLIGKNRTVKRTIKDFTKQFGVAIRIYKGRRIADSKLKISTLSNVSFGSTIDIEILPSSTVKELEECFFDKSGLIIQIEDSKGGLANNAKIFFELIQTKDKK